MIDPLDNHWFLADLHLGHANVLKHDNRPFNTIAEHDWTLTVNCAGWGTHQRTLWLLGDVATRKSDLDCFMGAISPRWGRVILIRGNHDDKVAWRQRAQFAEAHEAHYLRVTPDVKVYLSHYAHRVWRNSHHGSYHLHGHSHGALSPWGRSMDVGANCVGYRPISLTTIVEQLKSAPSINHHEPQ
jgi:calcineurin-like phosphoesterase family protein